MLRSFDVDCGGDLFPGHRVVVRGLVDHGRSRDDLTSRDHSENVECQMVSLAYELLPGVTVAEAAAREPGTAFTVDATYSADVPLVVHRWKRSDWSARSWGLRVLRRGPLGRGDQPWASRGRGPFRKGLAGLPSG